jgi:hypothetical protein
MLKNATRNLCALLIYCGAAYCQANEVDRLAAVVRAKIEADSANRPSTKFEWLKVGIGPIVTLVVSGFGAWYLQRLGHRQAAHQMLLENEIAARRTRDQLLMEKELEARQWTNQKLMEKRLAVFEQAAPLLNDLYCFMIKVGIWKDVTPPDALRAKRTLDRLMYVNQALFSDDLREAYFSFIHTCFETYTGWAEDAKLLPACDQERRLVANWDPLWEAMFSNPERRRTSQKWDPEWEELISNPEEHRRLLTRFYNDVMKTFAIAVGAKPSFGDRKTSDPTPFNETQLDEYGA